MDYQRACGVTGRKMQNDRFYANRSMNRSHQMGWQMPESRMPDSRMPDHDAYTAEECCEHLAIATSPVQCWQNLHSPCDALAMGTLFKDLHLPLIGCPGSTYRRNGGLQ